MERLRAGLADGPRTAFDLVPVMWEDVDLPEPLRIGWGLTEALCYLNHMELRGEVERVDGERAGALEAAPARRAAFARVQGWAARSAARIARVAGERFSV